MATIGNDLIGVVTPNLRLNTKILTRAALPDTNGGKIDQVEIYCGGNGAAGSGTATFKGVVYRDVAGEPGALLGTGAEVSVAYGAGDAWRASVIAAPAVIPSGDTHVYIGELGGPADNVTLYRRNTSGGTERWVADTYADGAADPAGAMNATANQNSQRATFTGIPVNSVAPVASGTGTVGQTLSVTTGTWSNSPTYTYQWKRDGVNIGGATSNTYLLDALDASTTVTCTVTATNVGGVATSTSNGIAVSGGSDVTPSFSGGGGIPRSGQAVVLSTAAGASHRGTFLRTSGGGLAATTTTTGMTSQGGFKRAPISGGRPYGALVYELNGTPARTQAGLARTSNGALAVTTSTTNINKIGGMWRDSSKRLVVAINTSS